MYEMIWRNKWLTAEAKTIDDMIAMLRGAADQLKAMKDAGVTLETGNMQDDYAFLNTDDPKVAETFGFTEAETDEEESDVESN